MASRISRRVLTEYVAGQLAKGDDTVLTQVAAYLIESQRTNELELFVRDIETALASKGVLVADVASARALTKETEKTVAAFLKDAYDAREVKLRQTVDPALVGGVRVRTPDAEYDATVRRKLIKLQTMKV